ncbi:hypothetical protein M3Y97_00553900 [Aphelenchoides bicaudatus]|nr:hypothetical protein M3Y97_00553900 [Aphelenchoides bicaudatus]
MSEHIFKSQFPPVPVVKEPLHEILFSAIRKFADEGRTAFILAENGEQYSYVQLRDAIYSISNFLEQHNFGHGDIACAVLKNCWQFVPIFISCIGQEGCLSPASALFTNIELKEQFKDSHSKLVFCSHESLGVVIEAAKDLPKLKTIIVTDGPETNLPTNVVHLNSILRNKVNGVRFCSNIDVGKTLVSLPYSSGTTGKPKGVMLTHKSFGTLLRIASQHFMTEILLKMDKNWNFKREYVLHLLPFYHIYGFGFLMFSVLNGARSVIMPKFEPELFCAMIEKYQIKFAALVPPILVWLSRTPLIKKYNLSSIKFLMSGAAPLGKEVVDAVHKALPNVLQVSQAYGSTEESMCSHLPVFGMENYAAAGRLISNYEQKIIDLETGLPLPIGQTGEVCIRSPTLMLGYFNRPEATRECMDSEGFWKTGDIGYQDAQGWTYIVDRLKELIKVKGLQVAPAELEDILLSHPSVVDCCVIGIPDSKAGEVPKAFVVKTDPSLTSQIVQKFVADKVAPYKQLAGGVEFVKEMPKSPSGKILRRLLRDKAKL